MSPSRITPTEQRLRRQALDHQLGRLARMIEIRRVEEAIQQMYNDGHVRGSTHLCNGQEAIAVGLASVLTLTDTVTCTYRGHGIALALGVPVAAVLGEIAGREIGCARGIGGSMHLQDPTVGLLPTFAIVGAGLPVAAGAALTAQVTGTSDVAVAVFGDGSTNIGAFHESLNLAAVWRLPVVFVCENNLYGEYSRIERTTPFEDLARRAVAYDIPGVQVDGQDVDAVRDAVAQAVHRARSGDGPSLLEMKTYRYSGHSRSDPATYRPEAEVQAWKERDPIEIETQRLLANGTTNQAIATITRETESDVQLALARALASPPTANEELLRHIVAVRSQQILD